MKIFHEVYEIILWQTAQQKYVRYIGAKQTMFFKSRWSQDVSIQTADDASVLFYDLNISNSIQLV